MGLAAGAQISQSINASSFPVNTFDPTEALVFDLTILNDATFTELKELPASPRMPTQAEYDALARPYFHLHVRKVYMIFPHNASYVTTATNLII